MLYPRLQVETRSCTESSSILCLGLQQHTILELFSPEKLTTFCIEPKSHRTDHPLTLTHKRVPLLTGNKIDEPHTTIDKSRSETGNVTNYTFPQEPKHMQHVHIKGMLDISHLPARKSNTQVATGLPNT